jgi:alpha-beta hydrolase superfamily lysophospholipase
MVDLQELENRTSDGKEVVIWRATAGSDPPERLSDTERKRVVVIAPGYGRRMRHMAAICLYLVRNGFVVYRYDSANHVGLSEGDFSANTLSANLRSLRTTLDLALAKEQVQEVGIVGASMSARVALRLAAHDRRVAWLIGLFGVVNVLRTASAVFGVDYQGCSCEQLPEWQVFENKRFDARGFCRDAYDQGWDSVQGTLADLAMVDCPVINFCGSSDAWVDVAEVRAVFAQPSPYLRRLYELAYVEHDLARNPVAARQVLRQLSESALDLAAVPAPVAEPSFEEIVDRLVLERKLEHESAQRRSADLTLGSSSTAHARTRKEGLE